MLKFATKNSMNSEMAPHGFTEVENAHCVLRTADACVPKALDQNILTKILKGSTIVL